MKCFIVLCVLAAVCSSFAAPADDGEDQLVLDPTVRDMTVVVDTKNLIVELAGNLRKSAEEALHAVGTFTVGIKHEAEHIRDKICEDIKKFRERVTHAVNVVFERISNSSTAVKECVRTHKITAAAVFNTTLGSTMSCVDSRIVDVSVEIQTLTTLSSDALAGANKALEDMKKCTANHTNLFAVGSCLGIVAIHTEMKSIGFMTHSAILMGRINLSVAALPASLEICAATRLIQAGIATGKIVIDIGTCSASAVFNTMLGRPTSTISPVTPIPPVTPDSPVSPVETF
ncbi:unnamed protein product [Chrysodeixis includens]|uniref:Uncharacterized protein n=1 Tax=Chrysodeixis includens TaxID=689277 RepID=A0A9P0C087_CHRIL|nr:unnamed protein product [Chrysodeixis includens]